MNWILGSAARVTGHDGERGRSEALGSQGRLIRPLEGWRFQHTVRELFHPSAAAGCCDFIFSPSPSIIRPLEAELSSRRLSSLPPAPCPSNLMRTVTAKPHGQHRVRRPLSERTETAGGGSPSRQLHATATLHHKHTDYLNICHEHESCFTTK